MSAVGEAAAQLAGNTPSIDVKTGAALGKSVSAWQRVFEREQMAALAQFRSVAMGGEREADAYGMSSGQPGRLAPAARNYAVAASSAHASQPGRESAPATRAMPAPYRHFLHAVKPSSLDGHIGTGTWVGTKAVCAPSAQAQPPSLASTSIHQTALLSAGDWPWRKLHCTVDADGVHVWLRDATVGAEDHALLEWIGQLRHALAQSGARLASFTLNGSAISIIA